VRPGAEIPPFLPDVVDGDGLGLREREGGREGGGEGGRKGE